MSVIDYFSVTVQLLFTGCYISDKVLRCVLWHISTHGYCAQNMKLKTLVCISDEAIVIVISCLFSVTCTRLFSIDIYFNLRENVAFRSLKKSPRKIYIFLIIVHSSLFIMILAVARIEFVVSEVFKWTTHVTAKNTKSESASPACTPAYSNQTLLWRFQSSPARSRALRRYPFANKLVKGHDITNRGGSTHA